MKITCQICGGSFPDNSVRQLDGVWRCKQCHEAHWLNRYGVSLSNLDRPRP